MKLWRLAGKDAFSTSVLGGFFLLGLLWVLLSQVQLIPWRGGGDFLGPDGVLGFLEEKTVDARLRLRGEIPSPVQLAYVNVDAEAMETLGNFPWSREVYALALDALFEQGGVRGVGIDFVLSDTGLPQLGRKEAKAGSVLLGEAVRRHGAVVTAAAFGSGGSGTVGRFPYVFEGPTDGAPPELPAYPIVGPTWGHVGLINMVGESVRDVPFFARAGEHTYLPMSLQLALIHWGVDASRVEIGPDAMVVRDNADATLARIPLILGQLVQPNWFSAWDSDQNIRTSIVNVIAQGELARTGTDEEKAAAREFFANFRDTFVLIGATDPLLKDNSVLPLSGAVPAPRVSIHGNLLKTLVSGRFLQRPPVWANVLTILALGLFSGVVCLLPTRWSRAGKIVLALLVVIYLGGAFALLASSNLVLPLVAPLGAAASGFFLGTILQLAHEQKQKRRIQDLFGSYVSSAVVQEMVEKDIPPQTGGAEVEITAFFSDIVSFSPIAEEISPTDLVELMSEYLGEGTAAVMAANGTLDKYVGDAIVSIFGAPLPCRNHAAAACRAALALQDGQTLLRARWVGQEGRWPARVHQMSTRVGLNTGPAIVGNIGSKLRFNYTMMGDTVNLAARLEGAAGYYGAHILVSGETFEAARRDDADLVFRALDRVLVPGRTQPVDVFELLGCGGEVADACEARILAYAGARAIYREGRWAEAREAFLAAAQLEPEGRAKNPASAMARRCEQMADRPATIDFIFPLTK
ncbi:MAG: CHASE2 domain-containing protein [Chthoniobacterales bacterium]